MTLEHVIPLRGERVSGLHVHNNLAIVWQDDNYAKGNTFHIEDEAMSTKSEVTPRQKEIKLQAELIKRGSIKTCTNCERWIEKTTIIVEGEMPDGVIKSDKTEWVCGKWDKTPPISVIVVGCEDHEDDIPF